MPERKKKKKGPNNCRPTTMGVGVSEEGRRRGAYHHQTKSMQFHIVMVLCSGIFNVNTTAHRHTSYWLAKRIIRWRVSGAFDCNALPPTATQFTLTWRNRIVISGCHRYIFASTPTGYCFTGPSLPLYWIYSRFSSEKMAWTKPKFEIGAVSLLHLTFVDLFSKNR